MPCAFAREGADIIALDICAPIATMDYPNASPEDLDSLVKGVEGEGRRIAASQVDVRDVPAVLKAVEEGLETMGRIDIVLPQAGIVRYGKVDGLPENAEIWDDILGVNISGYFNLIEATIPHLIAGGRGGCIVMTGSVAATRPTGATGGSLAYIAAKCAAVGLMKSYALALGKYGIRVNVVHPTGVVSGMTMNEAMAKLAEEAAAGDAGDDNWVAKSANLLDVQMVEPEDITEAVLYLVSDAAKWVTGEEIKVDAGFTLL